MFSHPVPSEPPYRQFCNANFQLAWLSPMLSSLIWVKQAHRDAVLPMTPEAPMTRTVRRASTNAGFDSGRLHSSIRVEAVTN